MGRKIVFRLDDICPQMDHERFDAMQAIFDEYHVKPIIGVVPDCQDEKLCCDKGDPEFWKKIRELQQRGWTIAMHGCFHRYVTRSNGYISHGRKSEFAGLPYEEQLEKLAYGQDKLKQYGIETDLFMAPSHSYDRNTLLALRKLGFRYVTDGLTSRPYTHLGLLFVPCIEPKISKARRFSTVCYHTNVDDMRRWEETKELLRNNRQQVISFAEAKALPSIPYWRARIEEHVRYFYKYYLRQSVWIIYHTMKKLVSGNRMGENHD